MVILIDAEFLNVKALSADAQLIARWRGKASGIVFGVYSQGIFLRDNLGTVGCLIPDGQQDGPSVIRLGVSSFEGWKAAGLSVGARFILSIDKLTIGQFTCDLTDIACWDELLPQYPGDLRVQQWLPLLRHGLASWGKPGGLRGLFTDSAIEQGVVANALYQRARNLLSAICGDRLDDIEKAGIKLLGLGGGLTPSGDDFLAALTTVFYLPGGPYPDKCREAGRHWAAAAEGATTAVSAFLLHTATQGRARAPVIDLLAALSGEDEKTIINAMRKTLAFGALSGTDWLAGLTAGLQSGMLLRRYLERGG